MPDKSIETVLAEHTDRLMALPGVNGTGQGLHKGQPCVLVLVVSSSPELERQVPSTLDGYPVRIEALGEVRPLEENAP